MEIMNNEIIYVKNAPKNYDSHMNNHEHYWKYATNTVMLKFTNVSDKPLVFLFDKAWIKPTYSKDCVTGKSIFQENKIKPVALFSFDLIGHSDNCIVERYHSPWSNDSLMYFSKYFAAKLTLDSLTVKEQLLKTGMNNSEVASETFYSGFYTIYPNQSKFIEFQIALPLTDYRRNFHYVYYNLNPNAKAFAQMTLLNNNIDESIIPNEILREIKENNFTLFNGAIKSNKVPVKMINMPAGD